MRAATAVVLFVAAGTTRLAWAQRERTTQTSIAIFYQPDAPETASLRREGDRG